MELIEQLEERLAPATLYWDTNSIAAGSSSATGTWGTSNFWTTDSAGVANTFRIATTRADDVVFSAGTNGGTGTVTLNGAQAAKGVTIRDATATLTFSNGPLNLYANGLTVNAGVNTPIINSNVVINGDQTWTVNSSFLTVASGVAGSGVWTKAGSGQLSITNDTGVSRKDFSFYGKINITGGTLNLGSQTAGGLGMSAVNIGSGAIYQISAIGASSNSVSGPLSGSGTLSGAGVSGHSIYGQTDATYSYTTSPLSFGGSLAYRGQGTQTFSSTKISFTAGVIALNWLGNITLAGALTGTQFTGAAPQLNGGTLTLDNTAGNATRLDTNKILAINGGGTFRVIGNASTGTSTTLASINFAGTGTLGGHAKIVANNGGAGVSNTVTFTSGISSLAPGSNAAGATMDFIGTGGTLGAANNNPRILLANISAANLASNLQNGVLKDSATTRYGWALANSSDFATYDATNGIQPLSTYATYASAVATDNAIISGSDTSGGRTVNTLKIVPSAAGQSLTGANALVAGGILLPGANSYTLSPAGGVNNANVPLYLHVPDAGGRLTITTAVGTGSGAITKSGDGVLVLSGGTNGTTGRITINGGVLDLPNTVGAGGFNATSSFVINNGGILQLSGGGSATFALGTANGNVDFEWGGGFAARGGDLTLNLGAMSWSQTAGTGQLVAGANLALNSPTADSLVNLTSNINLGAGKAQRDIYVYDNPNSTNDRARLSGTLTESNGAAIDLVKLGPGVLELTNTDNAYTGGTLVNEGELRLGASVAAGSAGPLGNSNGFVVVGKGAGTESAALYMSDNGTSGAYAMGRVVTAQAGSSGDVTLGSLDSNGTSTWSGVLQLNRSAKLRAVSGGTVDFTGNVQGAGGIIVSDVGTIQLSNAVNDFTGATTVAAGVLKLAAGVGNNIANSPVITVGAGSTLDVTGLAGSAITLGAGQILQGGGSVTGGVSAGAAANNTIAPGTLGTVGALALSSTLTINGSTILSFDVNGAAADLLTIAGTLTIATGLPTINLSTSGALSGSYTLATFATSAGLSPTSFILPTAPSGYTWSVTSTNIRLVAANDTTLWVGPTQPTTSLQNTTIGHDFGRVMKLSSPSFNVPLSTAGTQTATTLATVTAAGSASTSTTSPATLSSLTANGVAIGLSTTTLGSRSGTVTIVNQASSSAGASQGSDNGSATINVAGTVVADRIVTATPVAFGLVHRFATVSASTTLSSPGADNVNTRIVVDNADTDANGIGVTDGNPANVFDGSWTTDIRSVGGAFTDAGQFDTIITLVATGEGLSGEAPRNVDVPYSASVFSGAARWTANGPAAWGSQASSNWTDFDANADTVHAAPGTFDDFTATDIAIFDGAGTGTLVTLNNVSPSLAGIRFSSPGQGNLGYQIAQGNGSGSLIFDNTNTSDPAIVNVFSGQHTIGAHVQLISDLDATVANAGDSLTFAGVVDGDGGLHKFGPGVLILSGVNEYAGA
ncbi:MAG: autotransporter-associated beta strand repeat-containing protein, partial [Planctomycetota bacterium]